MNIYLIPKNVKRINMRLKDGALFVSYPYFLDKEEVKKHVDLKLPYFIEALERYERSYRYLGARIYLFGKPYDLKCLKAETNKVIFKENAFLICSKDPSKCDMIFCQHFKKELDRYVKIYYEEFKAVLKDYGINDKISFKYRYMNGSWGVCRPKRREITINLRLLHYPLVCLKSVVYHELVHLIVPNHSKRFYDILRTKMPEYDKAHEMLR